MCFQITLVTLLINNHAYHILLLAPDLSIYKLYNDLRCNAVYMKEEFVVGEKHVNVENMG